MWKFNVVLKRVYFRAGSFEVSCKDLRICFARSHPESFTEDQMAGKFFFNRDLLAWISGEHLGSYSFRSAVQCDTWWRTSSVGVSVDADVHASLHNDNRHLGRYEPLRWSPRSIYSALNRRSLFPFKQKRGSSPMLKWLRNWSPDLIWDRMIVVLIPLSRSLFVSKSCSQDDFT